MTEYDNIPEIAMRWHRVGKQVALATVIETWGSSPRPVGAQLVIGSDGEFQGSVSGGCVEGAVVLEAQEALLDGHVRLLTYGITDEDAFSVGLACGGTIRIMVEPIGIGQGMDISLLSELVTARATRLPVVLSVNIETWQRHLNSAFDGALSIGVRARLDSDKSGFEGEWFVAVHNPPLKMIIIGAVHIAQPLMMMARLCGYAPQLVDPRGAFASKLRFPREQIVEEWPDEALPNLELDARTAVITLTHDPKIDDAALLVALRSPVFYVGSLGSRKTHAKRVARLAEAGLSATQIARIHAPIGLDTGSKTPAEIAISIMAEVTLRLRRPSARD
ncbi:MAG: XdhC family protein [Alphaproteobacteria bacterium]|nr:XdhC family protein [Alphaproteobacteria bacterium]